MDLLAVPLRWIQVTAASLLVGVFVFLLLVARPALRGAGPEVVARFLPLDARLAALALGALVATLAAGLLDLWRQVVVATGLSPAGSLTLDAFGAVLTQTRYGTVWLARCAFLLLLGTLLAFREEGGDGADWLALRLEGAALATLSLVVGGAAGHAASAQAAPARAIAFDGAHLLAAGIWAGGLVPLALFLRWALTLPDGPRDAVAAVATRRFSALGLTGTTVLVVTGLHNTWEQVGGVPALLGTPYGRWLCAKILLLLALLAVAGWNLLVLKPRLGSRAAAGPADGGRPVRRLRRQVLIEVALAGAILGVVVVLGLTTPARHATPTWPLPFRFSWDATKGLPGVQARVAIGSQLALLGLVATLLAVIVRRPRWGRAMGAGLAGVALGLSVALPGLGVDAYPTTYLRPSVPYTATSIARGRTLYRTHCAGCHGLAGQGDGPAAPTLRSPPPDLTGRHVAGHTVGDLFWWLSRGIPGSSMRGFADRLPEGARWDLVNFLRALGAAEQARGLGPVATPIPWLVAPDFAYTTGVGEERALKDLRGQGIVVLVLFSLPGSVDRLLQLGAAYQGLRVLGAEVLGIPLRADGALYRQLGGKAIFFPLAVDGAAEAAATYGLFGRDLGPEGSSPDSAAPAHMELLVDRRGYLRARWIPGRGDGWSDPARLVAEVERLAGETVRAPVPDEHVH